MYRTYNQPTGFKHGFFDCCGNCGDCLFASFLPDCYAFVAGALNFTQIFFFVIYTNLIVYNTLAQDAGESTMCAILQCWCYPCGLCFLRKNAREKKGIEVSKTYSKDKLITNNDFNRLIFN